MTDDADDKSALVERVCTRSSRRHGELIERPMIGQAVEVEFLDPPGDLFGHVRRVSGIVRRNDAGELVVESWADGIRSETAVPRHDASVTVKGPSR